MDILSSLERGELLTILSTKFAQDPPSFATISLVGETSNVKKMKSRIICVTHYRLVILVKDKSKLGFQSASPIIQFKSLTVDQVEGGYVLVLNFEAITYYVQTEKCKELIEAVMFSFRRATQGWNEQVNFSSLPPSLIPTIEVPELSPLEALIQTYNACCVSNEVIPSDEFKMFISDFLESGSKDLDMTLCPGSIYNPSTDIMFDLESVAMALRSCTFYDSFSVRDIPSPEAAECAALIMAHSKSVKKICVTNTAGEFLDTLGWALQNNKDLKLHVLDIGGTKISSAAIPAFEAGLAAYEFPIRVLNLDGSLGSTSGVRAVLRAFEANLQLSKGLEVLGLANNRIDDTTCVQLISWLESVSSSSSLKRLSVANMVANVGGLLNCPLIKKLQYLDISNNSLGKNQAISIPLATGSVTLCVGSLAMTKDQTRSLLTGLAQNHTIYSVALDLSHSDLSKLPSSEIPLNFRSLTILDLTDNGFKKNIIPILEQIPQTLQKLILDNNFCTTTGAEEICDALGKLINTRPQLTSLSLASTKMGKAYFVFFEHLAKSSSLLELDISNNQMGDQTFCKLCVALRENKIMKWLSVDKNNITANGWLAMNNVLSVNKTLLQIEFPLKDQPTKTTQEFNILLSVFEKLHSREIHRLSDNPFEFRQNWILGSSGLSPEEMEMAVNKLNKIGINKHLDEPMGFNCFREYLITEFSEENLDFYQKAKHFESLPDNLLKDASVQIFNDYIGRKAVKQINVTFMVRKPIEKMISEGKYSRDMFHPAQAAVYKLFRQNQWTNYLKSEFALQYIQQSLQLDPQWLMKEEKDSDDDDDDDDEASEDETDSKCLDASFKKSIKADRFGESGHNLELGSARGCGRTKQGGEAGTKAAKSKTGKDKDSESTEEESGRRMRRKKKASM
eukprot:TRINITY_DN2339_c0_g2_i8.p1 TRINITY_DN2339_c0_g2~~TRINITY_DN2339_c0_g2_i8.p1  ORF type:complete len:905 (-),score=209.32 TRINITY_DN2339_c0_g2_i8:583-3297(-)